MTDPTLRDLIAVSKAKPRMRFLVCPACQKNVELQGGIFRCDAGHETATLGELAVKGEARR